MIDKQQLMKLRLDGYHSETNLPGPEQVLEWFAVLEAGWVHNGDKTKPHALLRSGKHSTGYFLCKRVLKYGNLREILAACMLRDLREAMGSHLASIGGVFGSPYSSILLAGDIARLLNVPAYVPEKGPKGDDGEDTMVFKADDPIPGGTCLLQVEELVTTWTSGEKTKRSVITGNPNPVNFVPFVATLVHRPPELNRLLLDGRTIVPFIARQVDAWEPEECPLCKAKSVALAPKANWAALTA